MKQISIQDLKATLSAAVAEAEAGQTIVITRHNTAVARLTQAVPPTVHHGVRESRRAGIRPAIERGKKIPYLEVLLEDRGNR